MRYARVGVELRLSPVNVNKVQYLHRGLRHSANGTAESKIKQHVAARDQAAVFVRWPIVEVAKTGGRRRSRR